MEESMTPPAVLARPGGVDLGTLCGLLAARTCPTCRAAWERMYALTDLGAVFGLCGGVVPHAYTLGLDSGGHVALTPCSRIRREIT